MSKPTYTCPKHGYPLYRKTDPCPVCRDEVEDEYGDSLDCYIDDDEDRDDRPSDDDDCMDCGMCDDCIERTIAANEESK